MLKSSRKRRPIKLHRYIWALPNTLLGLPFVPLAILTGGRICVVAGVLELHSGLIALILKYCVPIRGGAGALTLGHIVLGLDERTLSATRQHERAHVWQCEVWGPAFIPAYIAAWLWALAKRRGAYEGNYFEREAIKREGAMESKLEREVRFLKTYAIIATLSCIVLIASAFTLQSRNQKFAEIDVERINIVEKDGRLRMVISNQERQHPGIVNGKIIQRKGPRPPGMIFFNHLGDEMGGLIFGDNGGKGHFGSLTWDKVRNDQTIGFRHLESDNGTYSTGLEMWQQPNLPADVVNAKYEAASKITDEAKRKAAIQALIDHNELATNRLFLGKYRDNSTVLLMSDMKGKPRIRMEVSAEGVPKLEFLDEAGRVIYSLPQSSGPAKP